MFVVVPHFFGHAVHRGHARRRLNSLHDCVGLNRVIHEAEAENQADGKQDGQPALVQAVGNIIRRAAAEQTGFLVAHFINLCQSRFSECGTHADQRRYPHPKHGTRTAGCNGQGNAGNIARAHAAGQTGHKCLKRRDAVRVVRVLAAAADFLNAAAEQAQLHKAGRQREKNAHAD